MRSFGFGWLRGGGLASFALLGGVMPVSAQQSPNGTASPKPAVVPEAVAVRATPAPPRIDGRLDDEAWRLAPPIRSFTQRDPNEGQPGTERTEVRVLYNDDALYIGVRAFDSQPDRIAAPLTRRDEESPSDWIAIGIDSYYDRRTAFVFFVNPAGVKRDTYVFDDANEDDSWDAVWDVATARDGEGWTAEFLIPFSQLRFPKADQHRFGFNVVRLINRLNEEQWWRMPPKKEAGLVSRFGDLVGIEGIRPPRRVELLPYTAAISGWEPAEAGNPFRDGSQRSARVGADFNVGVTSNLTLSATINPDFGQVEADPAVVNLSAFETFYPERRPFFTEGLDAFRFSIGVGDGDGESEQLFYTRRVGRAPQGSADPRGGYAEQISQTTILSAAKLSGKTPGGWTIGLLSAVTSRENATVIDAAGRRHNDVVEPTSGYLVGRLARDFRNGQTQIGVFGTGLRRHLPENLQFLRASGYTGGIKWSHRFRNDTYRITGWMVGSQVLGSAEAIDATQRSSARYFQRPDNDYVSYNPARTALSGTAASVLFGKHGGGNWRFDVGVDTRSPGFEVNDVGYQREADRTVQFAWAQHRWMQPGKVFRRFAVNLNQWTSWNYGWDRLDAGGNVNVNGTFLNYWGGYAGIGRGMGGLATDALRGGPGFVRPGRINLWSGFWSDERKAVRGGLHGSYSRQDEGGGWSVYVGPNLSWRAASSVDLQLAPSLFRQVDRWQHLTRETALGADQYVFGELEQSVASMTLRANATFSPLLSLQVYAEPFVASGDYVGFKRVADPRGATLADRFDVFGADRLIVTNQEVAIDLDRDGVAEIDLGSPDFSFLSFRSNVVLRWEYLPGSTLFVVWQHGRSASGSDGRFRLGPSLDQLFTADATNTCLVKLNYWISL